jgi:uncharacterized protein (UPF0305 family)
MYVHNFHIFQESYNSLLQTGAQIKNRLLDSISKFNEYEETLDSVSNNLDKWEKNVHVNQECPNNSERLENAKVSSIMGQFFAKIYHPIVFKFFYYFVV